MPTEECASSLRATSGRSGAAARRRCPAVSRATMSADRLPGRSTGHEAAPGALGAGRPAPPARPRAWFSATTTPAASSQDVPCSDEQETNMSKSREALVGAAGMNDKKRGLSHETTAVDSLSTNSCSTSAASLPSGRHQPRQFGVERLDEAAEVEGDRVHGQSFPAGRQDEVGHRLVVVEHLARHQAGGSSGPARRPGRPARQASSARLATSWGVAPSWPQQRPRRRTPAWPVRLMTFIRMTMPSTTTCSSSRATGQRSHGGGTYPHGSGRPVGSRRAVLRRAWCRSGRAGRGRAGLSSW